MSLRLTPKEKKLLLTALRISVQQFSEEVDFNPQDWPEEKTYQQETRSLLRKMARELGVEP
jgi:hypothetical protein